MARQLEIGDEDRKFFVLDRIWSDSETILSEDDSKTFADTALEIIDDADFSDLNRDQLILKVYEEMQNQSISERDQALFLVLFDRTLSLLKAIEKKRLQLLNALRSEPEASSELEVLASGSRKDIFRALKDSPDANGDLDKAERKKSDFEGPFVRALIGNYKGARHYTKKLRKELATLLHKSESAIASMRAWKKDSLGEAPTHHTIVRDIERKVQGVRPDEAYKFISDRDDKAFAKSIEPSSFELDDGKTISREQRKWIYALMLLGPDDEKGKRDLRKVLAEMVFKCKPQKIAAVTAYLSPKFFEKARANKSDVWRDVEPIQKYLESKEGRSKPAEIEVIEDHTLDTDPDYDNVGKIKGWREPEANMIEGAWGKDRPLRGKRLLILESPQLLEWKMLERMGAEERLLTIVERNPRSAAQLEEKLQSARIIRGTLFDVFAQMAADRLRRAGLEEQYRKFGISEDDPLSYVQSRLFMPFPLNANCFKHVLSTSELEGCTEVSIGVNFGPEIPEDPEEKFDLISLDTKSLIHSEHMTLNLLFKLGLLGDESIFCTNFVAQRENQEAQLGYDLAIVTQKANNPFGTMNLQLDGSLQGKRDVIGVAIQEMAHGGRLQFHPSIYPYSRYFKYFGELAQKASPSLVKEVFERVQVLYRGDFDSLAENKGSKEAKKVGRVFDIASPSLFFSELLTALFHRRCHKVFAPLANKLPDNKKPQLVKFLRSNNWDIDGLMPLDISFAENICDILLYHTLSSFTAMNRERYSYRSNINMQSDFFHFKKRIDEIGISPADLRILENALYGIAKPKIKTARLLPCLDKLRIQDLREQMLGYAPRKKV